MQLKLIKNPDETKRINYKIARVIFAETKAVSLPVVEAMASMIKNISVSSNKTLDEIISDKTIFDSLNDASENNKYLKIEANNRSFQMCLRVVNRMMRGVLPDVSCGATRFHSADKIPSWATSRGYILDVDGFLFYL